MLRRQPDEAQGRGKLTRLLDQLREEALDIFRYQFANQGYTEPEHAPRFSLSVFDRIWNAWGDWQNGIPPGREWRGRGAQNPRLLDAFGVLGSAQAQAQAERDPGGTREAEHLQMAREFRKQVTGK